MQTQAASPTKEDVVQRLADAHRKIEPGITHIFRLLAPPDVENSDAEPIKLLEVNPGTTRNGIVPVYFAAHAGSGIYFPSIIVELHPEEFMEVQQGRLQLPHGWQAGREISAARSDN